MQALRKLVLLLVMLYILTLALVVTNLISIDFLNREFTHFNPLNFFKVLMLIGACLLGLVLAVEQSHAALLRRRVVQLEGTVQQLKAAAYDRQHPDAGGTLPLGPTTPSANGAAARPTTPRPSSPDAAADGTGV